jgi:ferredoxin
MKDKTLEDLFDFYPPGEKQDFYTAYLYLKHTGHFAYTVLQTLGFATAEAKNHPGPSVDEMLRSYVKQISLLAVSRDTNIYHGKVMRHRDARKLVTIDRAVRCEVPEKVVPFKIARDVILDNPGAIAVGTCACRQNQPHPCLPESEQDVCLMMGDPFASFIAAHNPHFRKCSQEEAVRVLEKAHERGDVHTAYFKKEMGKRLMAICNCCSCCCMGMLMWNRLKGAVPFLAPSGYVAEVKDECTGCGICVGRCPFDAISLDEGTGKALVDFNTCMGCGVCQDSCPGDGVKLRKEPLKGEPLDLDLLKTN